MEGWGGGGIQSTIIISVRYCVGTSAGDKGYARDCFERAERGDWR